MGRLSPHDLKSLRSDESVLIFKPWSSQPTALTRTESASTCAEWPHWAIVSISKQSHVERPSPPHQTCDQILVKSWSDLDRHLVSSSSNLSQTASEPRSPHRFQSGEQHPDRPRCLPWREGAYLLGKGHAPVRRTSLGGPHQPTAACRMNHPITQSKWSSESADRSDQPDSQPPRSSRSEQPFRLPVQSRTRYIAGLARLAGRQALGKSCRTPSPLTTSPRSSERSGSRL